MREKVPHLWAMGQGQAGSPPTPFSPPQGLSRQLQEQGGFPRATAAAERSFFHLKKGKPQGCGGCSEAQKLHRPRTPGRVLFVSQRPQHTVAQAHEPIGFLLVVTERSEGSPLTDKGIEAQNGIKWGRTPCIFIQCHSIVGSMFFY